MSRYLITAGAVLAILIVLCLLAVPSVSTTPPLVPPLIKESTFSDIDGDSIDEIVVSTDRGNYILDIDGNTKEPQNEIERGRKGVQLPEWVDLDREGSPEYLNITSDGIVVSDENGTLRWEFKRQIANATASDLDHDGYPEIIYIHPKQYPDMLGVLNSQGNLKFEVGTGALQIEKLRTEKEKEDRYIFLIFGAYLLACIFVVIFERGNQSIRVNRTALRILIILSIAVLFLILVTGKGV